MCSIVRKEKIKLLPGIEADRTGLAAIEFDKLEYYAESARVSSGVVREAMSTEMIGSSKAADEGR